VKSDISDWNLHYDAHNYYNYLARCQADERVYEGGEKRGVGKWRRRTKRGTGKKSETLLKIPARRREIIARRHSAIPQHRLRRRLNISGRAGINICKITSADAD